MPAKRNTQKITTDGLFFSKPLVGVLGTTDVRETRTMTETRVINRIRVMGDDSASGPTVAVGRKLIRTALKGNMLSINVGSNPFDSEDEHESKHQPSSPQYKYCGKDIRKLSILLTDKMLECTATLSYGDGGMSTETDEDCESAVNILLDNYREPSLILFF